MTLREEWLTQAMTRIIEDVFTPHELRMPVILKVSCAPLPCKVTEPGETPQGTYGCCSYPEFSDDGAVHIFINTVLGNDDVMLILSTLTHELVHANCHAEGYHDAKHGHPFNKTIRTVGLEGKPARAHAQEGTELWATLSGIAQELGTYPHAPLRPKAAKKRVSRTLTWVSETDEDYTVKANYDLTEAKGAPRDFNGQPMVVKDKEKLSILENLTEEEIAEEESEALPE
jgi:hypothetical protein